MKDHPKTVKVKKQWIDRDLMLYVEAHISYYLIVILIEILMVKDRSIIVF